MPKSRGTLQAINGVLRPPPPVNFSPWLRAQEWGCHGEGGGYNKEGMKQAAHTSKGVLGSRTDQWMVFACSLLSGAEQFTGLEAG